MYFLGKRMKMLSIDSTCDFKRHVFSKKISKKNSKISIFFFCSLEFCYTSLPGGNKVDGIPPDAVIRLDMPSAGIFRTESLSDTFRTHSEKIEEVKKKKFFVRASGFLT